MDFKELSWDTPPLLAFRIVLADAGWYVPNGKGAGRLMAEMVFQVNVLFEEVLASPPWGRRERGLVLDLSPVPFPEGKGCLLAGK